MAIRKNNKLFIFLKLFILNFIGFSAINVIILILKNYCNFKLFKNYELYSFASLTLASVVFALSNIAQFICVTKAIRTDDKNTDKLKLMDAIDRIKWRRISEDGREIIFKSKFLWGIFDEKIIVKFNDTELHIFGPKESVRKLIFLINSEYEAYEIRNASM